MTTFSQHRSEQVAPVNIGQLRGVEFDIVPRDREVNIILDRSHFLNGTGKFHQPAIHRFGQSRQTDKTIAVIFSGVLGKAGNGAE
jgi:hypothetical protein